MDGKEWPDPKPNLPPFEDPASEKSFCIKCGCGFSKARYCPGKFDNQEYCGILVDNFNFDKEHPEHLHRICERCGYTWLEKTSDTTKPESQ